MNPQCCMNNKGWKIVVLNINENNNIILCQGFYNVRVVNSGNVSARIGNMEITPGNCVNLGIDWLPCAENIDFTWMEETGDKNLTVTACQIVEYCPSC